MGGCEMEGGVEKVGVGVGGGGGKTESKVGQVAIAAAWLPCHAEARYNSHRGAARAGAYRDADVPAVAAVARRHLHAWQMGM